jgi:glycosyltransferase involved in cell wall biosynthesis
LKILFLCNKSPWPPKEGGAMAMNQIVEGLTDAGHSVKVLAVNSKKYNVHKENIPQEYLIKTNIEWVDMDLSVKVWPAFSNFILGKSYHVARFVSEKFKTKLVQVLKANDYDIVQLETLFMVPYVPVIRANTHSKIVLRLHNIEHLIWRRMYSKNKYSLKGIYFHHLFKTLKDYELKTLNQVDALLPITGKDAEFFKKHTATKIKTIPYGIELPEMVSNQETENALFYIGAMNWMPNIEGIQWFLKNVWPSLNSKFPQLKFYLAGREMPQWLRQLEAKNIDIMGEVPDAEQFVRSKKIAVVPLFSGSGVRIKIIESMSLGKAVISTHVGAEGIDYENGKNIIIADTAEEFIQAISTLYTQPKVAEEMGKEARRLVAKKHQNHEIIKQLAEFYQEIL